MQYMLEENTVLIPQYQGGIVYFDKLQIDVPLDG